MLPYTASVQRLVATLLGFAFVGVAAQGSALHTHSYASHGHPEHRHGPAAHEHPQPAPHHDEHEDHDAVHLESCDPGQHAVSVTIACPPLPRVDALAGQSEHAASVDRLVLLSAVHPVRDVRVHGPPSRTQTAPRAPPLTHPA